VKIKLATALTLIAMVLGGWLYIDRTKADTTYMVMVEQRLDIKINKDKISDLRMELRDLEWCLEDEPTNRRCKKNLKQVHDELNDELKTRERLYEK
jgi:uncharacterized membrane protein